MGWKDAPEVPTQPTWMQAPLVESPTPFAFSRLDPIQRARFNQPPAPSIPGRIGSVVKEGALPTLGQIGGAAVGVPFAPVTGGVAPLVTEAIGSAGGEALSQKLGLTKKSVMEPGLDWKSIVLSGVAPGVGRGLAAGVKGAVNLGARMLPGAGVGLHEWGAAQTRHAMDWLAGHVGNPEKLYRVVEQYNPVIDTSHTQKALQELLQHYSSNVPNVMETHAPVQEVKRFTEGLLNEMQATQGMSFQKLRGAMKLMNENYGTSSGTLQHAYGKTREAIWKDMEEAAARPTNQLAPQAVAALKTANTAFKKQLAYDELKKIIEKQVITSRPEDLLTKFNRRPLLQALKTNETITKNLSSSERIAFEQRIKGLGTIPSLPSAPGSHVPRILLGSGLGGAIGYGIGGGEGARWGALAVPMAEEALQSAMMTEPGKRAIVKMATSQGPVSPKVVAALSSFLSGQSWKEAVGQR